MMTPAQAHFLEHTARLESAQSAAADPMAHATGYELMLAKLADDRRRLHAVASIERKIDLKRELLPDYAPYIAGALAGGKGGQDDVLMSVLVWYLDTSSYTQAFPLAEYALTHSLTLPDQYKRNLPCLLAEEVTDTELRKHAAAQPLDLDALQRVMTLTAAHDMPDEVRAKLNKAVGYALRASEPPQTEAALDHLRRAFQLHDKAGVKKDIERLESALKNAPPADPKTEQTPAPIAPTA